MSFEVTMLSSNHTSIPLSCQLLDILDISLINGRIRFLRSARNTHLLTEIYVGPTLSEWVPHKAEGPNKRVTVSEFLWHSWGFSNNNCSNIS